MKNQESQPDSTENAIAHQPLWMAIPQESQEKINGGIGYKHLHRKQIIISAGKAFKEKVAA